VRLAEAKLALAGRVPARREGRGAGQASARGVKGPISPGERPRAAPAARQGRRSKGVAARQDASRCKLQSERGAYRSDTTSGLRWHHLGAT
jgi:hypothetical protein